MDELNRRNRSFRGLLAVGGVTGLVFVQQRNYLLFHSLVEGVSILVAFAVFVVVWNTRERIDSLWLAVLGVAYLFVGGGDLLHTLSYSGMGIFPDAGADLPTQFWIFTRYVEVASLLGATVVGVAIHAGVPTRRRQITWYIKRLPAVYGVVFAVGVGAIMYADVFPTAYVEGSGLTPFKVGSEYLMIGLLGLTLVLLYRSRGAFDARVVRLFGAAILLSMGAELAFTLYVDVYGVSNAAGHFLKLGSFGTIYVAVVRTGLRDPQRTLYRSLAEREARARTFEKAIEHTGHAVVITDAEGSIEYVNSAFEEITGYTAGELRGENPSVLQSGEHDTEFYDEMWSTILSGDVWQGELVNERKNGERFVVNPTIAPITQNGTIEHFVGVHRDISNRKRLERTLQQRYEVLFESIGDAIVVTDTDYRISNANAAFTDLFGYDFADVEGKPTARLLADPGESEEIERAIRRHRDDERFTRTIDYEKASGQVFPGQTTFFYRLDSSGDLTGYIGLIRDVSEREKQVQQIQVLGRVLRHNLRNDMNVVQGFAQAIKAEGSGQIAEYADRIIAKSESLMDITNKEYAITQFLSSPPETKQIDIVPFIQHVVSEIRAQYPGADITTDLPEACSVRTTTAMQMVIEELVLNSIVHADKEHPTVRITCASGGGTTQLRVADDGPGIPDMEQKVLSGEADIKPLYHGSGLGLWLVYVIVRHSDGHVAFDANDPRGSVVSVAVPTADVPADRVEQSRERITDDIDV